MKKKLVSILLCVSMVSAMVAGCGSSSSDEKKEDTKTEDTEKKDDAKEDAASGEDTDVYKRQEYCLYRYKTIKKGSHHFLKRCS